MYAVRRSKEQRRCSSSFGGGCSVDADVEVVQTRASICVTPKATFDFMVVKTEEGWSDEDGDI